jgi:hypothetical protein
MIIDAETEFSDAQALTTTEVGDNVMDLINTYGDIGVGEEIIVEFSVPVALTGGTSVTFEIVNDDNASLSSPAVIATSEAILSATLVAGYKQRLTIPAGATQQRYLGVQYTIAGTYSAGSIDAYVISPGPVDEPETYLGQV